METTEIEDLDAAGALCAFGDLRRARARAERDILVVATHFADLYNVDSMDLDGPTLPGTEKPIRVASQGAPLVREFAVAEMAVELATTTHAAKSLMGDGLELRHRLPLLWARVLACEVPVWIARKIAQATRALTPDQAATVDAALVQVADGRVGYRVLFDNLDAAVIAADPDAAAERERRAAEEEFAKVGQSNTHGRKTLYIKTSAAHMARIDATIAYLADALRTLGDPDTEDHRRTKAVLILANPTEALRLLQTLATHKNTNTTGSSPGTGIGSGRAVRRGPVFDDDDAPLPDPDDTDNPADPATATATATGTGTDHPADPATGTDDTEDTPATGGTDATGSTCPSCAATAAAAAAAADPAAPDPVPDPVPDPPPPSGDQPPDPPAGTRPDPAAGFTAPFHPTGVPPCPCRGGTWLPDQRTLLPTVTLYLHLEATHHPDGTPVLGPSGVARWEDEGPITAAHVREFLGPHARFVIKPVIDLPHQTPTAAYEVRGRLREAVHLRNPLDAFPYATNTTRHQQIDHTTPYTKNGEHADEPQTRMGNLAPMTTYHHRLKTHAGWTLTQPLEGIYLWKSPHGSVFLVDHTGTRQIRRPHNPASAATTPAATTPAANPADPATPAATPAHAFAEPLYITVQDDDTPLINRFRDFIRAARAA